MTPQTPSNNASRTDVHGDHFKATRWTICRWLRLTVTLATLILGCGGPEADDSPTRVSATDAKRLTEFQLIDSQRNPFHSDQLKDHVWVASYFFTQCGANCRTMNMKLAQLSREYGPLGVRFVSITCDPMHDAPEVLADYARNLNANPEYWSFLTGDWPYLQQIGTDLLSVTVATRAHNARITIVDRAGQTCGTFDILDPAELQRAVQLLDDLVSSSTNP